MSQTLRITLLLLFMTGAGALLAQNYVGSQTCMACHNNVNQNTGYNIWVEFNKTGHPFKLNEVNGAPPVYPANTSPGVNNAPPAMPDWNDYSYVIGGYGWKARFIQKADGNVFTSDPAAQWNLATQEWVPYEQGKMKPYNFSCFQCHTTGPSPEGSWHPTTPDMGTFTEPGIRCEGCHGPGGDHVGNPINVKPPIQADSLAYTRCGDCHSRGSKTNAIPASGGYIRHHEQFNEMKASRHGDGAGADLTCGTCHDTHIALVYPQAAGAGLKAIKTECESCHAGYEVTLANGQVKPVSCESCHMPKAGKSAVGTQVGNGFVGDVSTHIWTINTDPVTRDAMFDGSVVKLDENGLAAVTLDFACLNCHQDKTVDWASRHAKNIHSQPLAIDDHPTDLPRTFELQQNYPNPFNPSTTIRFELPRAARVILTVHDILGKEVAVLVKGVRPPGVQEVVFSAENLPSGIYIYRLETEAGSFVRKMVLMR